MSRPGKPDTTPDILWNLGDIFLPKGCREFLDKNIYEKTIIITKDKFKFYINGWSIVHFISGILVSKIKSINGLGAFILHSLWELFQIYIGMTNIKKKTDILDTITDTIFFMFGWFIGTKLF